MKKKRVSTKAGMILGSCKGVSLRLSLEVPDGESVSIPSGDLLSCEGH